MKSTLLLFVENIIGYWLRFGKEGGKGWATWECMERFER